MVPKFPQGTETSWNFMVLKSHGTEIPPPPPTLIDPFPLLVYSGVLNLVDLVEWSANGTMPG